MKPAGGGWRGGGHISTKWYSPAEAMIFFNKKNRSVGLYRDPPRKKKMIPIWAVQGGQGVRILLTVFTDFHNKVPYTTDCAPPLFRGYSLAYTSDGWAGGHS